MPDSAGGPGFRTAALERLASPEELHRLMRIDDPRAWLGLLACVSLIGTAVGWGFFGRVPTRVQASGILIHSAGLAEVAALGAGQVTEIDVDVGDYVQKGQVIAALAQPELQNELRGLRTQLRQLELDHAQSEKLASEDVQLRQSLSSSTRVSLQTTRDATAQRKQEIEQRLTREQALLERGLVTHETVRDTRQQLRAAEASLKQLVADMQRTNADAFSVKHANAAALQVSQQRIEELRRQIGLVEQRHAQQTRIVSPLAGRVVEVRATVGDVLAPGSLIASLERSAEIGALEALLYVDSQAGERVAPGMSVQLSPSIVRREKHGVVLGTVTSVESFPSTRRGMMRVLHNEQLIDAFLRATDGAPIALRARLLRDPASHSGYRWSSRRGPAIELTSGTRVAADVTIKKQRPIALVFPFFEVDS